MSRWRAILWVLALILCILAPAVVLSCLPYSPSNLTKVTVKNSFQHEIRLRVSINGCEQLISIPPGGSWTGYVDRSQVGSKIEADLEE